MTQPLLIHATAVAIDGRAVLLRGASGSGKSDLGLRLIDAGGRLVADDQSELRRLDGSIIVRAPATIAGLIEVRGVGLFRVEALAEAPVVLVADLVAPQTIERLPAPRRETILGVVLPVIAVAPFEASAVAKLRFLVSTFTGAGLPIMLDP